MIIYVAVDLSSSELAEGFNLSLHTHTHTHTHTHKMVLLQF